MALARTVHCEYHGLTCQEKEWLVGLWRRRRRTQYTIEEYDLYWRKVITWAIQCCWNGISGGEPTWPIRGAWGARSSLQVNLTTCFHRPHICLFSPQMYFWAVFFSTWKLHKFCIYVDVFYITHMPYVENIRFLHICHVETSEISPHVEKFSISPQLWCMES